LTFSQRTIGKKLFGNINADRMDGGFAIPENISTESSSWDFLAISMQERHAVSVFHQLAAVALSGLFFDSIKIPLGYYFG